MKIKNWVHAAIAAFALSAITAAGMSTASAVTEPSGWKQITGTSYENRSAMTDSIPDLAARATVRGTNGYAMPQNWAAAKALMLSDATGAICAESGWKYNTAATSVTQSTSGRVCGAKSYVALGHTKVYKGTSWSNVWLTETSPKMSKP